MLWDLACSRQLPQTVNQNELNTGVSQSFPSALLLYRLVDIYNICQLVDRT
jgi:hypothetical protein